MHFTRWIKLETILIKKKNIWGCPKSKLSNNRTEEHGNEIKGNYKDIFVLSVCTH